MAIKVMSFSLDESTIDKIKEMVDNRVDVANRSHLITIAVLNEYSKYKENK